MNYRRMIRALNILLDEAKRRHDRAAELIIESRLRAMRVS
jgi:hypothetical protein